MSAVAFAVKQLLVAALGSRMTSSRPVCQSNLLAVTAPGLLNALAVITEGRQTRESCQGPQSYVPARISAALQPGTSSHCLQC